MPARSPVFVQFKRQSKHFEVSNDGYVWLINKFLSIAPALLDSEDPEHSRILGSGQDRLNARHYFGRTRQEISSGLEENDPSSCLLLNGWFVHLTLNNETKLKILRKCAAKIGLARDDWAWRPDQPTVEATARQESAQRGSAALAEIRRRVQQSKT